MVIVVGEVSLVSRGSRNADTELGEVEIRDAGCGGVVGREESIVLRDGEVHRAEAPGTRTRDHDAWRVGSRATAIQSSKLLGLKSCSLLGSQRVPMLIGHDEARRWHPRRRCAVPIAFGRAGAAEFADVVKLDAVIDGRERCKLHGCRICYHLGFSCILAALEVRDHGCVDHGGPIAAALIRGE